MMRFSPVLPVLAVALGALLTACDNTTNNHVTVEESRSIKTESRDQPLDLTVTQGMLNSLESDQALTNQEENKMNDQLIINLEKKKSKPVVGVSGEVFYDETSEDYLQAIDGGRINVELKFK